MENIVEPNDTFDFSKLSLGNPTNIQGGSYFTVLEYNSLPIYIQAPKCLSKHGIVKTGKKYYMDLMFGNNDAEIIKWIENLEETCKKLLFDKRDEWFQNSLDENDIDNAFNSIFKIFKSGRYYVLKCNVKSLSSNEPNVKIYNENEEAMSYEHIDDKTELITIIEIRGIRFTTRNFQLDIELKQIMVLDNDPLFNNCIIKNKNRAFQTDSKVITNNNITENTVNTDNTETDNVDNTETDNVDNTETDNVDNTETDNTDNNTIYLEQNISIEEDNHQSVNDNSNSHLLIETNEKNENLEKREIIESNDKNDNKDLIDYELDKNKTIDDTKENTEKIQYDIEPYESNNKEDIEKKEIIKENLDELEEIDVNLLFSEEENNNIGFEEINIHNNHLEENHEMMLKKPNQIFYDLYKDARDKAKKAKKDAVLAFLEAKKIKQTYMLENLNELDNSDIDEEIDEVSESELECLE